MKYRRELDIRRFSQAANEQSSLIQLVTAMQEIKLNNCDIEGTASIVTKEKSLLGRLLNFKF